MLNVLLILIGFAILIYGANLLVGGASSLAQRFNVPNIVIGLTIVAFGTSAPELVVNLIASANGNSQIVIGNVIGSNIFNIAAILGISSLIYPLSVKSNTTWIEVPLAMLSAFAVIIMANDQMLGNGNSNQISRSDGIILLLFFLIFLAYNMQVSINNKEAADIEVKKYSLFKSSAFIILGLAMLVSGGKLIVNYAVIIAQQIGLSERVIALTIVSIGTSLPELATSLVAVSKRNVDIAIGNVVGSCIFNVFFILGMSSVIHHVPVLEVNQFDLWVNMIVSFLVFIFVFTGTGRKLHRWEGAILLLAYIAYLVYII